jgi:mRNA interferase MazF
MSPIDPKRGEIWCVDFDPTRGQEIQKSRPAIVLSSDVVGKLNLKIVVPLTKWRAEFQNYLWHVQLLPDEMNGLEKVSSADLIQVRSVDIGRFINKIVRVSELQISELLQALAIVVEWS